MRAKTIHECHLNQFYNEVYTEDSAVEAFIYLTNKSRGQHTTEANIRKQFRNGKLGSLVKKLDPIAYQLTK